jgi:hypothetical protein
MASWFQVQCTVHCKIKDGDFPVSSRDVTNQTLPGRETEKSLTFFTVFFYLGGLSICCTPFLKHYAHSGFQRPELLALAKVP